MSSWLADATVIAVGVLVLGLMLGAILYLADETINHIRSRRTTPTEHAEHMAAQNGRPHGAHIQIYPTKPPAE